MLPRKDALHCKRHTPKTAEHNAKVSAALRGRTFSDEHRRKISEGRIARFSSGPKERHCAFCGKTFNQKPSSRVQFCSRNCGYANRRGSKAPNWHGDMPTKLCRVCGKEFRIGARTLIDKRFTCSHTCKNIWQKTHQKRRATNIEQAMATALDARGWVYREQVGLCNIAVVDFYLPESRTVICCDGDYWHGLPEHVARDERQTHILTAAGYQVYRFWGSQILANVDQCLASVRHLNTCDT